MNIETKNLSYSYDPSKKKTNFALKDVNVKIDNQEFLAIIGPTGSGKSTFIQNLNALLLPTIGEVVVDEYIIKNKIKIKNIKQLRKKIGIVFQFPEYQLFEETVEKDILFGPKNFNLVNKNNDLKEMATKVLDIVGLNASYLNKAPFELSGGEKRKVAIAGILAFEPDVLIVDEPTAGLDPIAANNMMNLFYKLHNLGKTIILVTHQMEHVLEYANRVIVFNDGTLSYDGKPWDLFSNLELVKKLNIDVPNIIKLYNLTCKKYPKLANYKVTNITEFIKYYKEVMAL